MYRFLIMMAVACVLGGCSRNDGSPIAEDSALPVAPGTQGQEIRRPTKLVAAHLPSAVRVHDKVISGGLPEGDAAFQELRALGVKTIISVDGAKPDVDLAARHEMRYVHLPFGYDGIPDDRVKELAKAVRDLEGPIYIHCHHGKHRSPAAAGVACVASGLMPPKSALAVLHVAGTSQNYRGLFQSAEAAVPLDQALLDALQVEFRTTVELPPMAEAMVAIEHVHDRLKAIAAARWRTPAEHPDLVPAHEALLMREHFTELLRADYVQREPQDFLALLRDSRNAAQELETLLRNRGSGSSDAAPLEALQRAADRISQNCQVCHQRFRDIPLSEKRHKCHNSTAITTQ